MPNSVDDITQRLINLAGFVSQLCQPLFDKTCIKSFGYIEIFDDGRVIQLESNPDIYKLISQLPGQFSSPANVLNYHNQPGVIITDFKQKGYLPELYQKLANDFDLTSLMIIIQTHRETDGRSIRYFAFSCVDAQESIYNLVGNRLEELKGFAQYFVKRVYRYAKDTPKTKQDIFSTDEFEKRFNTFFNTHQECLFEDKIPCPFHLDKTETLDSPLSPREQEVVDFYIKGYGTQETANLLNVSKRTIDRHFENIRKKLKVNSKREILIALDELKH